MSALIHARQGSEEHGGRTYFRRCAMKWETPQAVELRFGMEITMYVANR